MVLMRASLLKLPSVPKGRSAAGRTAGRPRRSARPACKGSTTLPLDLLILPPSSRSQPWPNTFWEGQAQRHQNGGPDDGVEPDDLLAHKVDVGGPEFVKVGVIFRSGSPGR